MSSTPYRLSFGPYLGKKLSEVRLDYLQYLNRRPESEGDPSPEARKAIARFLDERKKRLKREALMRKGYSRIGMRKHFPELF